MRTVMGGLGMLRRVVEALGPYLLLELLLPGGTLFALLLYVYRRRRLNLAGDGRRSALPARG
jgi:hypothetical protein